MIVHNIFYTVKLAVLILSVTAVAKKPISDLELGDFPNQDNTDFTNAWEIRSVVANRFRPTNVANIISFVEENVSFTNQITITINGTKYCLTDRNIAFPFPPQFLATLEPCMENPPSTLQLWVGEVSYFRTKVPPPKDPKDPLLPGYGPNTTYFFSRYKKNKASNRCLIPSWSDSKTWLATGWPDPDGTDYSKLPLVAGYVGLIECKDPTDPVYSLRDEVIDAPNPNSNAQDPFIVNLRFNQPRPDLPDGIYSCPINNTDDSNLGLETPKKNVKDDPAFQPHKVSPFKKIKRADESQSYVNTAILPRLIPKTIGDKVYYPAYWGCARKTPPKDTGFPSAQLYI
ncbi:hypothetical protein TWF730_000436 [Orbilia blumenaviensis]|uniref:Uncharacterized protein n=1 Tax=Orbilia blumenaviensis TaxID=1796055 RepID=A0AAV9VNU7_9PEZI